MRLYKSKSWSLFLCLQLSQVFHTVPLKYYRLPKVSYAESLFHRRDLQGFLTFRAQHASYISHVGLVLFQTEAAFNLKPLYESAENVDPFVSRILDLCGKSELTCILFTTWGRPRPFR